MASTNSWSGNLVGELHCLTKPPNPEKHIEAKAIDIVALHDIRQTTDVPWGTGKSGTWLRQLLPKDIRGARIFTFCYNTEFVFGGGWENFETAVLELLRSIATARGTVPARRPLVLMCHGLSALLIEAVVARMLAEDSNYLQLGEAVKAVIFLNGSQRQSTIVSWPTLLLQIAQENLLADPRLESTVRSWLQENASSLEKLPLRFKKLSSGIKIISLYGPLGLFHPGNDEELLTLGLKREKKMLRPNCDHQSIAEFTNRDDEGFQFLVKELKSIIKRANKVEENSVDQGHGNTTEAAYNDKSAQEVTMAASHRPVTGDIQASNPHAKDLVAETLIKRKPLPRQGFEALKPRQAGPPSDTTGFNQIQYPTGQFAQASGSPELLVTHRVAPPKVEANEVFVQKDSVNNHQTSTNKVDQTHPLAPLPKDQVGLGSFQAESSYMFPVRPSSVNMPAPTRSKPATRVVPTTAKTEYQSSNASLPNTQQQSLVNLPPPRRKKVSDVLPGAIKAIPPTLSENPKLPLKRATQKLPLPTSSLPSTRKEPRPLKVASPAPTNPSRNITAAADGLTPQSYPKPPQQQAASAVTQHVHGAGQQYNMPKNSVPKAKDSGFFGKLFSSSSSPSSSGSKESISRSMGSPGLHQPHTNPQRPQAISRPPNDMTARAQNVHPPSNHGSRAPLLQTAHINGFGSPAANQQQRGHHTPPALIPGRGSVNNTHGSNNTSYNIPSSLMPGGRNNLNSSRGPQASHNNYGGQVPSTHHANTYHSFNPPRNNGIGTHSPLGYNDSRHHTPTYSTPSSFHQYINHPQYTGINGNGYTHNHNPQYHHDPPNSYYDYQNPGWDGGQHHNPSSSDDYLHRPAGANGSYYEQPYHGNSSNGNIGTAVAVGVGGLAVGAAAAMAISNIGDDSDVDNSEGEAEENDEEMDSSEEEEYEEEDEDEDDEDEEEVDISEEEIVKKKKKKKKKKKEEDDDDDDDDGDEEGRRKMRRR
ncbi:hypothetical protein GL218_05182 [Daldinia childiae]|uniref:uncharacterized protein n=1 Tax=Daldinia childiae TaxID=326645 RepID=UPI001446622B|nr:uncharacterized protein GL218_05182 [Daldinia childiae]KAF3058419.1 hypothetical protein GL218_05182 [Daldinia childiae]